MLTKQDLNAIGNLIDIKFKTELKPIHNNIKGLKTGVQNLENSVDNLQKDMTTVKSGVKKLRKDLEKTIGFFDNNDVNLHNKLNKTRSEIGLSEFNFA